MSLETLLVLSVLGGLLTVEGTAVGQFMLSRPLVAGALAGWLVGAPAIGFAVGALLEMYLLVAFPVGGARFPEGAPATVAGVAAAAAGGPGMFAVAIAMALVWGQIAGLSTTALRTVTGRLVPAHGEAGTVGTGRVLRAHLAALSLDLARGCVLTALAVWTSVVTAQALGPHWPMDAARTRGLLLLGGLVSLGVLLRSFGGLRRRVGMVGAGLAVGVLVGLFL